MKSIKLFLPLLSSLILFFIFQNCQSYKTAQYNNKIESCNNDLINENCEIQVKSNNPIISANLDGELLYPVPSDINIFQSPQTAASKSLNLFDEYIEKLFHTPIQQFNLNIYWSTSYINSRVTDCISCSFTNGSVQISSDQLKSQMKIIETLFELQKNEKGNEFDPVYKFLKKSQELNKNVKLAFRVSDSHYASSNDPANYFGTSTFWRENQSLLIGENQLSQYGLGWTKYLLDFKHSKVRNHFLEVVQEAITKYENLIHGVQLDFVRSPYLLKPYEGIFESEKLTDLIFKVKEKLNISSANTNSKKELSVRILPSIENSNFSGLNIQNWISQDLVNEIVVSPIQVSNSEIHIDSFRKIIKDSNKNIKLIIGIPDRRSNNWNFQIDPSKSNCPNESIVNFYTCNKPNRALSDLEVWGTAKMYLGQEIDGIELFNGWLSYPQITNEKTANLIDPILTKLNIVPKTYPASISYYKDFLGLYEFKKQLPLIVNPNTSSLIKVQLPNIEDNKDKNYILRIGLLKPINSQNISKLQINEKSINKDQTSIKLFTTSIDNNDIDFNIEQVIIGLTNGQIASGQFIHLPIAMNQLKSYDNIIQLELDQQNMILDVEILEF